MSDITSDTLHLPRDLVYVAAMDWGHNQPGCIGWAALMGGSRIHLVREWKFTWLADEDIADGYKKRTKELGVKVQYVAGDPSMWIRDGRNKTRGQQRDAHEEGGECARGRLVAAALVLADPQGRRRERD
jgi:hypothetical protein